MRSFIYQISSILGLFCLFMLSSITSYGQAYTLYGIVGDYLVSINTTTGVASEVTPLTPGYTDFSGLTYEASLDQLMAVVDRRTDPKLVRIDPCSGEITVIGPIDLQSPLLDIKLVEAMEYNPGDGLLYASGYELNPTQNWFSSRRLMTVDPLSGSATQVATISGTCQNDVDAMAFSSDSRLVIDGCPNPKRLYSLNVNTGAATFIGSFTQASGAMLAVHPTSGQLYSTINGGGRSLYQISPSNGAETYIGQTHNSSDFDGGVIVQMAFAPSLDQDQDGYTVCQNDCEDNDPLINPGAIDICDNIDNNCNGQVDEDIDPDPVSSIQALIELIEELVDHNGAVNGLTNKLLEVINKLNDENTAGATGQMNAFNNQLSALIDNGTIDTESADILQGIGDCLLNSIENGDFFTGGGGNQPNVERPIPPAQSNRLGQESFELYPNPTQGLITLSLEGYSEERLTIAVYNARGQEVYRLSNQVLQSASHVIELSDQLPDGLYFLRVANKEQGQMKKFMLTR